MDVRCGCGLSLYIVGGLAAAVPVRLGRSERATRILWHTMVASAMRFWNDYIFDFVFELLSSVVCIYEVAPLMLVHAQCIVRGVGGRGSNTTMEWYCEKYHRHRA